MFTSTLIFIRTTGLKNDESLLRNNDQEYADAKKKNIFSLFFATTTGVAVGYQLGGGSGEEIHTNKMVSGVKTGFGDGWDGIEHLTF